MQTKEGCGLGPHVLPYFQNTLLIEPEWPINDIELLRTCGSYTRTISYLCDMHENLQKLTTQRVSFSTVIVTWVYIVFLVASKNIACVTLSLWPCYSPSFRHLNLEK